MSELRSLTIGQLARTAGVNVETIRYYQRRGLLERPARPVGSVRHYMGADVERVRFVKAAQRLGFSLDDVAELLRLEDGTRCTDAREMAQRKLGEVRSRIDDLQCIEVALRKLVQRCEETRGQVNCPLIASLRVGAPA